MSSNSPRTFEDVPAVRTNTPVFVGLVGPSGSGKTFSAGRLATGIQRVSGGDIFMIDTEARRGLHYADRFKFRHVEFAAPFSPLDYLAAVEHCVRRGAKTVIVDSMSHEHEGPGGVLEWHERELDRMAGDDFKKRERNTFAAWAKPKAARRQLINAVLQLGVNAVFCFRAKEKIKLNPRAQQPEDKVKNLGWMPIAGEEFIYEMTLNCLLMPGSGGVPSWHPEELGEKAIVKLPEQFRGLFSEVKPLSEDIGQALAEWAAGVKPPAAAPETVVIASVSEKPGRDKGQPVTVYTVALKDGRELFTMAAELADKARNAHELSLPITVTTSRSPRGALTLETLTVAEAVEAAA